MDVTQEELISMIGLREALLFGFRKQLKAEQDARRQAEAELVLVREEVARLQKEIGRVYGEPT